MLILLSSGLWSAAIASSRPEQAKNIRAQLEPADTTDFVVLGQVPGRFFGQLAVQGDYLYMGVGGGSGDDWLAIVDISTPTQPITVSQVPTERVSDIVIAGDYAYVADEDGLKIVNIQDPTHPVLTGTYESSAAAQGLAIQGNTAYIANLAAGLRIVDIANPAAPSEIGVYQPAGFSAWDVDVAGNYAYVIDDPTSGNLRVVDISTPQTPTQVGVYHQPALANNVSVHNQYAYITYGMLPSGGGLIVVDISAHHANPGWYLRHGQQRWRHCDPRR